MSNSGPTEDTSAATCGNCGAALRAGAEWCGRCLTPVPPPQKLIDPRRPEKVVSPPLVFSRWRAGPESFGPVGRGLLTLALAGAAYVGFPLFQGILFMALGMPIPVAAELGMYAILAVPLSIWALLTIWKRARIK